MRTMSDILPTPAQIDAVLAGPDVVARETMAVWAAKGAIEAQLVLGQMLLDGRGGPMDPAAGFHQFLKAARASHPMAMNMVGRCYENGWGVATSDEAAASWYGSAARAGLHWGMYNFATSLALGRGVAQDRQAARGWLEKAVALNHAKSMSILGGFLEDGWAGPKDLTGAYALYARAAIAGDFRGAFNLGRMLNDRGAAGEAIVQFRTAWRDGNPGFRAKLLHYLTATGSQDLQALGAELEAGEQQGRQEA